MVKFPRWFLDELTDEYKELALNGKLTSKQKANFICSEHGVYSQLVGNHIRLSTGEFLRGCPKCSKVKQQSKRIIPQVIIDGLVNESDRIRVINKDFKDGEKFLFNCSKHGNFVRDISSMFVRTTGELKSFCSECSKEKRLQAFQSNKAKKKSSLVPEWFINEIYLDSDKEKARRGLLKVHDYIQFFCPIHGVYTQMVGNHIYFENGEPKHSCPRCVKGYFHSKIEDEVFEYVSQFTEFERHVRGVINGELDLYSEKYRLAIEVNGSYYHASLGNNLVAKKSSNYHFNKFFECKSKGIRLINLFDVDWENKQFKVKNILSSIFSFQTYYARKIEVKPILYSIFRDFCNEYHLNNTSRLVSICYGLYFKDTLLGVIGFGRSRFSANPDSYEVYRFCMLPNVRVVGGFTKVLKRFEQEYKPKILISYSDNDFYDGKVYEQSGFVFQGFTSLPYYWYKKRVLERFQTQPKVLKVEFPELYDLAFNQKEYSIEDFIMLKRKYYKVYRSGNRKWVKVYE